MKLPRSPSQSTPALSLLFVLVGGCQLDLNAELLRTPPASGSNDGGTPATGCPLGYVCTPNDASLPGHHQSDASLPGHDNMGDASLPGHDNMGDASLPGYHMGDAGTDDETPWWPPEHCEAKLCGASCSEREEGTGCVNLATGVDAHCTKQEVLCDIADAGGGGLRPCGVPVKCGDLCYPRTTFACVTPQGVAQCSNGWWHCSNQDADDPWQTFYDGGYGYADAGIPEDELDAGGHP
ncbi:MAG: hypothetical protein QM778_38340 [Myxococcales bacterium]